MPGATSVVAMTGTSASDHGLLIVPPLVIVRADVSWQLAGMSRRVSLLPVEDMTQLARMRG